MTEKQRRRSSIVNSLQTLKSTLSGRHTIKEDKGSRREYSQLRLKPENEPPPPCMQTSLGLTSNSDPSWILTPSQPPKNSHGAYQKEGRRSVLSSLGQRYLNRRKNASCDKSVADISYNSLLRRHTSSSFAETPVDGCHTLVPSLEARPCVRGRTIHRKEWGTRQQPILEKGAPPGSPSWKVRLTTQMPHPRHRIPDNHPSSVSSSIFEADAQPNETMASRRIRWANGYENQRNIGPKEVKGFESGRRSSRFLFTRIPLYLRRSAPAGPVVQVTEHQPRQYWLGRFVTLTNAFHYEDSFNQPDIATGFGMLSSYSRPLGCSDADLSNYRVKRAFMVLENVCTTEQASASLRAFREEYIRFHGDGWMR